MSAVKHTPGPWKFCSSSAHNPEFVTANNKVICSVWLNSHTNPISPDEWKANIQLIAAAPQLLEMLTGILPEFRAYVEAERDPDIKDRNESWLDGMEALIAKATGAA
jgi:hypothetical protein